MKLPHFAGVLLARALAFGSFLYRRTPAWLRPFLPYIGGFLFWGALIAVLAALNGCHVVPTVHTTLPSPKAVQTTLTATRKTHDQVQQLADQAAAHGLTAGSATAKTLQSDVSREGNQLARLSTQVATFAVQQLAAQQKVDATEKDRDAQKSRADAAEKARDQYKAESWERLWIIVCGSLGTLVVVSILGAFLQTALRTAETFAAREAVAAGTAVVHAAEEIPKVAAVAAVL